VIGSGLGAEVNLFCDEELMAVLERLGEELRFVLIVSKVTIEGIDKAGFDARLTSNPGLKILVSASKFLKCDRCWHHHSSVGKNSEHSLLCERCITNIEGLGESRSFV